MFRQNQDMIRSNYICKSYDKSDKCEFEKQEINKEAKTDFSSESQIIKTEKSRSIAGISSKPAHFEVLLKMNLRSIQRRIKFLKKQ